MGKDYQATGDGVYGRPGTDTSCICTLRADVAPLFWSNGIRVVNMIEWYLTATGRCVIKKEAETTNRQLTPSWDLVGPAYELLKRYFMPTLILIILPTILFDFTFGNAVISNGSGGLRIAAPWVGVSLAVSLWLLISTVAFYIFQLRALRGQELSPDESLLLAIRNLPRFIGLSLLVGLIILGGLLLFIVPGIFMIKRYLLSYYYLLDRKVGIREAMRLCAADAKEYSGALWGTFGLAVVLSIGASMVSGVMSGIRLGLIGSVVTAFVSAIIDYAFVLRYRELQKTENEPTAAA